MSVHYRMLNTPLKRHPHQSRMRPNVSALAYSKNGSAKASKNSKDKAVMDLVSQLHHERRMHTEPLCGQSNEESVSRQLVGCSPSLKAQKRQYLKLFSTASTEKEANYSSNHSNKSVKGSTHSQLPNQPPSIQQLKSKAASSKDRERAHRGVPPRRRLFGDFVIENEQKIDLDEVEIQCLLCKSKEATNSCTNPCNHFNKPQTVCHGCLKILNEQVSPHIHRCVLPQEVLSLQPMEQLQAIKRRGMGLIRKLQSRSGELDQLADHCSAFLKECDLAWSAGRPSEIYNFKLRELRARNRRLAEWMEDLQRLNQLLVTIETQQRPQSP